jgi:hypothetical protein
MIAGNPPRPKGDRQPVSVIGRLDGQVEELLIKPAGRRAGTDEATSADDTGTPARPAAVEIDATDAAAEELHGETTHEVERERRPDALPVWLL